MQIVSENYGHYFDTYQRQYPDEFHENQGYSESNVRLNDDVSEGELDEICFQGVRIYHGRFRTRKTDFIRTSEDFPSVEMMFRLQGHLYPKTSSATNTQQRACYLTYRPESESTCQLSTGNHQYVGIQLTESFFWRFVDESSPTMSWLMEHVIQQKNVTLSPRNPTVGAALQAQLRQFVGSGQAQPLRRLYLEMTVLDLLRQQIGQADAELVKPSTSLRSADVDKILAVKALLDKQPLATYSLMQLAQYAGLNDFKLKKGFRDVLGTTVFGYLNSVRMNYARQTLLNTSQSIAEVAVTLGYSETHHFSVAFKRTFGYLPSQLRMSQPSSRFSV